MTREEILEYNKRCADFLGWKYVSSIDVKEQKYDQSIEAGWYCEIPKILHTKINRRLYIGRNHHYLQFHLDWNLIMEMVEGIEGLGITTSLTNKFFNIMKVQHRVGITLGNSNENCLSKKEAVVQGINQFLIWYNDNKTN
jgi:hypothetical protein